MCAVGALQSAPRDESRQGQVRLRRPWPLSTEATAGNARVFGEPPRVGGDHLAMVGKHRAAVSGRRGQGHADLGRAGAVNGPSSRFSCGIAGHLDDRWRRSRSCRRRCRHSPPSPCRS
jgi:hypothetical protein